MKFLLVLVTVSCAISFSECIPQRQVKTVMSNILDCRIMEGFIDVDMKTLFAHKLPKRYIEKCLAACIGEIAGFMKDRKVIPDGFAALANKSFDGNYFKVEVARSIAEACTDVTDEDRCEAAVKIFECMKNDAQSKGISTDDL